MPGDFSFRLDSLAEDTVFYIQVFGDVTLPNLNQLFTAMSAHQDYSSSIDELFDYTAANFGSLKKADIDVIHRFMLDNVDQQHRKSAIVVDSRVDYGIARMLGMTLATDVPADRLVAYSLEEAVGWLRPGRTAALLARLAAPD